MRLKRLLPHRHPFCWWIISKIMNPANMLWAINACAYREDFLQGISTGTGDAGVLIIEALAQVGAVAVLMQEENKGKLGYFRRYQKLPFQKKKLCREIN